MDLKTQIKTLTAEDGPNIPLRTLAIYCGVSHSTLSKWLNGKSNMTEELQEQVKQGIRELVLEICEVLKDEGFYYRYLQPEEYERQKLRNKYVLGK